MAISTGNQLAQGIRQRIVELKQVCQGLDEGAACRAPEGRWSPKEIVSHLLGAVRAGRLSILQAFLEGETPRIGIGPEKPFFFEKRAQLTFTELLEEVEEEYDRISWLAAGLSKEQLDRKAQIPLLKESQFGEHPTLETWIGLLGGMGESHLQFYIDHMRELLRDQDATAK